VAGRMNCHKESSHCQSISASSMPSSTTRQHHEFKKRPYILIARGTTSIVGANQTEIESTSKCKPKDSYTVSAVIPARDGGIMYLKTTVNLHFNKCAMALIRLRSTIYYTILYYTIIH
jgi:hypothetical protein